MSDVVFADYDEARAIAGNGRASARSLFFLKVLAAVFGAVIVIELLVSFFILPQVHAPKIVYSPVVNYSREELDAAISAAHGDSWIGFDIAAASLALTELPGIESASISRHFPDKIVVTLTERIPVALTLLEQDGHTVLVQIDRNGVLFRKAAGSGSDTLPLVTGLPVEGVDEQPRVPLKYRDLMARIAELNALPSKFFAAVSEIHVVPKQYGNYELVLYPVHSNIKVLVDRNFDETVLENMLVALDVISSIDVSAKELDLRYGSISSR